MFYDNNSDYIVSEKNLRLREKWLGDNVSPDMLAQRRPVS